MLDPLGAAGHALDQLAEALAPEHPAETRYFRWRELPLCEWFAGMEAAAAYLISRNRCWTGRESFVDVGSGLGTKLALAAVLGWQAHGVEAHRPYVEVSRRVWPDLPVTAGDAWEWDGYGRYDLVYSYRLCTDLADQAALTARMVAGMRPGALLFAAGGPDPGGLVEVGSGVWRV